MSVIDLVTNLGCDSVSSDTDSGCSLTLPSWRGSLSLSWEAGREVRERSSCPSDIDYGNIFKTTFYYEFLF